MTTATLPQDQGFESSADEGTLRALEEYLEDVGDARVRLQELETVRREEIALGVARQAGGDPDCIDCAGKGYVARRLAPDVATSKHSRFVPCPTCRPRED